jgi:Rrf2 family transcriptional regulator, cysteine metabolism repressor
VQSRDLAEQEEMPTKFLESILLALRRGGFLESKVGSGGGYRLSRHPREISMGDLIRRLEGRLTVHDKKSDPRAESSSGHLAVRFLNQKLTETIDKALDELTLEELVEQINRAGAGAQAMYYI